jgi:N-methylhydantoinase A
MTAMTPATASRDIRIGIDVGGTFTDVVADWGAGTARGKVPSTPDDPEHGVFAACELIAATLKLDFATMLGRVGRLGLGTTVVTNVLATRTGRRLGLLTTAGFEDIIPFARGYAVPEEGWLMPPALLVPRERIVGVHERCDRDGKVAVPVDVDEVVAVAERLVEEAGVEAIVVSYLWSFRNPANEQATGGALLRRYPDLPVVLGSAVAPVIREYERTQFALLNASVAGALDWLAPLERRLRAAGLSVPVVLMHSNGGAVSANAAHAVPIGLAQSGPAAGAAAAVALSHELGGQDAVACDMGGTSLDVALVHQGEALRRTRGRLVGHWTAMSMVDVDSVGSGGGSVAWVDAMGALRVGPRSAGARPGPACYGLGGEDATVTDALVVLGYLDPANFLGGKMPLDADAAWRACERLGGLLGLGAEETAWGVREVALTLMAKAVRARLASRGLSGAGLALFAYGGCGPLFGADIAAAVGAGDVVVPELAAVFSAFGAATTPLRRERTRSLAERLPVDAAMLRSVSAELWEGAKHDLIGDGVASDDCIVALEADMRFERQSWELSIMLPGDAADSVDGEEFAELFRDEYVRRFGKGAVAAGVAVELVTVRAVATERRTTANTAPAAAESTDLAGARVDPDTHRAVMIRRAEAGVSVPVFGRERMLEGTVVRGPALIDSADTTVWVPPGREARVGPSHALLIEEMAS